MVKKGIKKTSFAKKYLFGFIDEIGLLQTPKEDRIFGLGLLKLHHPRYLHKEIINFKNSVRFYNEFKFREVSRQNLPLFKQFVDLFLQAKECSFSCLIFDKYTLKLKKYFKGNYHKAYNSFTAKLIACSLLIGEYIAVLADDVNTPKSDNFEKEIKSKVKSKLGRNALFGICRVESHAVSEIQMTDVILGIIAYGFKIKYGLVKSNPRNAKYRLLKYLEKKVKKSSLTKSQKIKMPFGKKITIKEIQFPSKKTVL